VVCLCVILLGVSAEPIRAADRHRHLLGTFEVASLQKAVEHYRADCGQYPSTDDGLNALVRDSGADGWHGPYIMRVPVDPWNRPFIYSYPPGSIAPEIVSYGADQKLGGQYFDSDISSRNLWRSIPETPWEAGARYMYIGLWILAWPGFIGSAIALVRSYRRQQV
jgi:type II secretion system protein G